MTALLTLQKVEESPKGYSGLLKTASSLVKGCLFRQMTTRGEILLTQDLQLFRRAGGIMKVWDPAPRGETPAHMYLEGINWKMYPPVGQIAHLWDVLFRIYKREVYCLIILNRDGVSWTFLVPKQVGSPGGVTWDDDAASKRALSLGRVVGSVHSHPGTHTSPSGTDTENWGDPLQWGIHYILGRDESFTMCLSSGGVTVPLKEGSFKGVPRVAVRYEKSQGLPLKELLGVPPKPKKLKIKMWDTKRSGYWDNVNIGWGANQPASRSRLPQGPYIRFPEESSSTTPGDLRLTVITLDGATFLVQKGLVTYYQEQAERSGEKLVVLKDFYIEGQSLRPPGRNNHGTVN